MHKYHSSVHIFYIVFGSGNYQGFRYGFFFSPQLSVVVVVAS